MTLLNSKHSVNFLLYFILLYLSGCAEVPSKHLAINQTAAEIHPVSFNQKIATKAVSKNHSRKAIKPSSMPHKTVWDRLFALYALPEIDNARIEQEIQGYLKHPNYLTKIQQRAEPYLYFIVNEIEAKQLPGELALLPVIESAFLPNAVSKSKASGLWQFMPATGRFFGLKQNWWYDGRNDIYASTQAATTYLKQLGKLFDGDWLLALASYNAGKGTISKAQRKNIKKNLATDYWSLSLSDETRKYVPKLLAIARIFANTEKYKITLHPIANKPYFSRVNIESQIDLSLAAKMAQTSIDNFLNLNPAHKRWTTDPDGPYHLLVHTEKSQTFKTQLASTQKKDRLQWIRHKIHSGENLSVIAHRYHTTVNALRQSNRLSSNTIRTGRYLLIPGSLGQLRSNLNKTRQQLYTVKKGDTFWDIARHFSVKSKDIAHWNNLSLSKILRPGQKLIIKES
ncbi:MAG: LysM peptidoglycan-binding domain-containing protein [Methylococcales bacterium]|jgi:membrane-bound lytic murein transglycosylase D